MTTPAFTIQQLTGAKRFVRLTGRGLPFRPLSLGRNVRLSTTWSQGDRLATQTVLGTEEEPTQIAGVWHSKHLGNGSILVDGKDITTAVEAEKFFLKLLDEAQLCEVTWGHVVRRGTLASCKTQWLTLGDCEYTMTWEWIGEPSDVVGAIPAPVDIGQMSQTFRDSTNAMQTTPTFPFDAGIVDSIASAVTMLSEVSSSATALAESVVRQAVVATDAARNGAALCASVVSRAEDLIRAASARDPAEIVSALDVAIVSPAQRVLATQFARDLIDSARDVRAFAVQTAEKLTRARQPTRQYTARSREDLRDVSQRFYNTPFEWRRIQEANLLDGTVLEAGQTILIPEVAQ